MKKTWMPEVAGVLDFTSGLISLAVALFLTAVNVSIGDVMDFAGVSQWLPFNFLGILWAVAVLFFIICGGVALAGGIIALRRRTWGLAVTGSVVASFPWFLLGITAVALTALATDEFAPVGQSETAAPVGNS